MFDMNFRATDLTTSALFYEGARQGRWTALVQASADLYQKARRRAWRRRLWSMVTRQPARLLSLAAMGAPLSQRYIGLRTVRIDQIVGSENRCGDFDGLFYPLGIQSRNRWMSVAGARLQGLPLPAVTLIQVGDVYFVRDGHHRISVAQTLGQRFIEAEVTEYEVTRPLSKQQVSAQPALKPTFSALAATAAGGAE